MAAAAGRHRRGARAGRRGEGPSATSHGHPNLRHPTNLQSLSTIRGRRYAPTRVCSAGRVRHHPAARLRAATASALAGHHGYSQATRRTGGWISLFDGRTLTGWHAYQQPNGVTTGWSVDNGAMRTDGNAPDLVSDQQYSSFELDLEWKVAPGANSGIFYWANEGTDGDLRKRARGSGARQRRIGRHHADDRSWCAVRPLSFAAGCRAAGRRMEHGAHRRARFARCSNGSTASRSVDVNFDSKEMKAKIAASKFNQWLTFGKSRRGHLGLQSHGGTVWFRNIRIKDFS